MSFCINVTNHSRFNYFISKPRLRAACFSGMWDRVTEESVSDLSRRRSSFIFSRAETSKKPLCSDNLKTREFRLCKLPSSVPLAARSKAKVYGCSTLRLWVRISPWAWTYVCCVVCVVRWRSLWRADHSSRGVLPTVVRHCVWSRNLVNEEALAKWGCRAINKQTNKLPMVCEKKGYWNVKWYQKKSIFLT